jgi:hypothetical protein
LEYAGDDGISYQMLKGKSDFSMVVQWSASGVDFESEVVYPPGVGWAGVVWAGAEGDAKRGCGVRVGWV